MRKPTKKTTTKRKITKKRPATKKMIPIPGPFTVKVTHRDLSKCADFSGLKENPKVCPKHVISVEEKP